MVIWALRHRVVRSETLAVLWPAVVSVHPRPEQVDAVRPNAKRLVKTMYVQPGPVGSPTAKRVEASSVSTGIQCPDGTSHGLTLRSDWGVVDVGRLARTLGQKLSQFIPRGGSLGSDRSVKRLVTGTYGPRRTTVHPVGKRVDLSPARR